MYSKFFSTQNFLYSATETIILVNAYFSECLFLKVILIVNEFSSITLGCNFLSECV